LFPSRFFLLVAAAETQLPLPLFFDPYIIIMSVSTSLQNKPAAAAKSSGRRSILEQEMF
jgi:hypothetical protein